MKRILTAVLVTGLMTIGHTSFSANELGNQAPGSPGINDGGQPQPVPQQPAPQQPAPQQPKTPMEKPAQVEQPSPIEPVEQPSDFDKGMDNPKIDEGKYVQTASQCRLDGTLRGLAISVGIGGQVLMGRGVITCGDESNLTTQNVRLRIFAGGLGVDVTYIHRLHIAARGIESNLGLTGVYGGYRIGHSVGMTLIHNGVRADSFVNLQREDGSMNFDVGLMGEDAYGLGVRLHGQVLHIHPM